MCPPLTVIVPVFNEAATVAALLTRVVNGPYPSKQVIVVDDGSTDSTPAILRNWEIDPRVLILRHPTNRGKGAAVRTGLEHALGKVTLVQDADLEYEPADYPLVVEPILRGEAAVVYGSRYLETSRGGWSKFRVGVAFLNGLVRVLYGQRLTDEATCYKAAPTVLWRALALEAKRFEFCAEATAKFCRLGCGIREVPIRYNPRSVAQGKKIGWKDAWPSIWTLLKWRFRSLEVIDGLNTQPVCHAPTDCEAAVKSS